MVNFGSLKLKWMFAALTRRKGMMLSLAMACRSRGAPVSDWRPAPHVEKKEPITMTQGVGQARVPTTRFPLTESPNLQEAKNIQSNYNSGQKPTLAYTVRHKSRCTDLSLRTTPSMQAPNKTTLLRSGLKELRKNNTQKFNQIRCIPPNNTIKWAINLAI